MIRCPQCGKETLNTQVEAGITVNQCISRSVGGRACDYIEICSASSTSASEKVLKKFRLGLIRNLHRVRVWGDDFLDEPEVEEPREEFVEEIENGNDQ